MKQHVVDGAHILRRTPEISTGEAWDIEYLQMKVAEIWIGHLNRQADLS